MNFQELQLEEFRRQGVIIDPTAGGKLTKGEHKIGDLLRDSTHDGLDREQVLYRTARILAEARPHKFLHDAWVVATSYFKEAGTEPDDTTFLTAPDSHRQQMFRDFLKRMMLPGSGLANEKSMENFHEAMELHRSGQHVVFDIVPHSTELDPVIVETIISMLMEKGDDIASDDAEEFLAQVMMLIGHKVHFSQFRRVFLLVKSIIGIAIKYREGWEKDEKNLIRAHGSVTASCVEAVRVSAHHLLMRCPEGGRTKKGNIGTYKALLPSDTFYVPLMLDMPENYLGIEAGRRSQRRALIRLFCGAPHQVNGGRRKENVMKYVVAQHAALWKVQAPVERYAWGYKEIVGSKHIDPRKGAPEEFIPLIQKGSNREYELKIVTTE